MGLFLALAVSIGCLSLNPTVSYANGDAANGGVKINDNTNFPDKTFREFVKQYDTDHNGYLSQDESDQVTEISIGGMSVSNLKGIEHFKNLKRLYCQNNLLTSLDVSHNPNLTMLHCLNNHLSSLDVSKNLKLTYLTCGNNFLTSLDVSKNTSLTILACDGNFLTSLDVSHNTSLTQLACNYQHYNITVIRGIRKFEYSKFPRGFDKGKVTPLVGATFGDDALIVNDDNPSEVFYEYKVGNNRVMNVTLNVTYFDPTHVVSMSVKTQPKLSYTEGDRLDLTGLVVTLTDNQGATIDVPFTDADFNTYGITATPANRTSLTVADHNEKPVILTKPGVQQAAETENLTVNKAYTITYTDGVYNKEIFPDQVYKVALGSTTPAFQGSVPSREGYEFKCWNPAVADKVTADVTYVAQWKKDHFTVTFKDGDKTQTVKVETSKAIDESMPANPTKAGYTFKEWNTKADGKGEKFTGASVVNGDMTVYAIFTKNPEPTPTPTPIPTSTPTSTLNPPVPTPKPTQNPPTLEPKSQSEASASKSQHEKRIGMIPKTGESASFAGLLTVLGFSIVGLVVLCRKRVMEGNDE